MQLQYAVYLCLYCVSCQVKTNDYFAVHGTISDASLLTSTPNIRSLLACAKRCEHSDCVSVMYKSTTKLCSTFSTGISVSSELSSTTGNKYFQKFIESVNCAPINVYGKWAKCNTFNSKRWTIVQRRYDGSETFDKSWNEFKSGFGDLDGEYWIGNEALHRLTQDSNQVAMFVVEDWNGVEKYAQYDTFKVSSEADNYRLTATGYSGTAGDCMSFHNGQQFTTKDKDNDGKPGGSCSQEYDRTGFWFQMCVRCNINALYVKDTGAENAHAITWISFSGKFQPMRKTRLMLRRFP